MIRLIIFATTLLSLVPAARSDAQHDHAPTAAPAAAERQLYTCGMHPQVIRDQPGTCPICGMELTPLKPAASQAVIIDPAIVQNMGVRTATAVEGPLRRTLRAVGYLAEAQPNQHDINLRVSGWIEKLYADVEGMHVQQGAPLFDLYSPELQVAIEELIAARRAADPHPNPPPRPEMAAGEGTSAARRASQQLLATARRKLELLGLSREQVEALGRLDAAPPTVTFRSPITGHVVEKPIVDGAAVTAGMRALRIVDHSSLWLDIAVYEQDLPFVHIGQTAHTRVEALPGESFDGSISFMHPHVDPMTRTVMARVVVTNPDLELRPGMYASVDVDTELAPNTLLVPRDAVIDTGTQQVVFVALPEGHFDPRRVTVGSSGEDQVQILAGLAPGDEVVTSGQFLLDAESRFREAVQRFLSNAPPGAAPAAGGAHVH